MRLAVELFGFEVPSLPNQRFAGWMKGPADSKSEPEAAALIVHGWGGNPFLQHTDAPGHIAEKGAESGIVTFAAQAPGHDEGASRVRIQDFAPWLNRLVVVANEMVAERYSVTKPLPIILVGHSLGTIMVASVVADKRRQRNPERRMPEQVCGVVYIAPVHMRQFLPKVLGTTIGDYLTALADGKPTEKLPDELVPYSEYGLQRGTAIAMMTEGGLFNPFLNNGDAGAAIAQNRLPTLAIVARQDPAMTPSPEETVRLFSTGPGMVCALVDGPHSLAGSEEPVAELATTWMLGAAERARHLAAVSRTLDTTQGKWQRFDAITARMCFEGTVARRIIEAMTSQNRITYELPDTVDGIRMFRSSKKFETPRILRFRNPLHNCGLAIDSVFSSLSEWAGRGRPATAHPYVSANDYWNLEPDQAKLLAANPHLDPQQVHQRPMRAYVRMIKMLQIQTTEQGDLKGLQELAQSLDAARGLSDSDRSDLDKCRRTVRLMDEMASVFKNEWKRINARDVSSTVSRQELEQRFRDLLENEVFPLIEEYVVSNEMAEDFSAPPELGRLHPDVREFYESFHERDGRVEPTAWSELIHIDPAPGLGPVAQRRFLE